MKLGKWQHNTLLLSLIDSTCLTLLAVDDGGTVIIRRPAAVSSCVTLPQILNQVFEISGPLEGGDDLVALEPWYPVLGVLGRVYN